MNVAGMFCAPAKSEALEGVLLRTGEGREGTLAGRETAAAGEVRPGIVEGDNHVAAEAVSGRNGATSPTCW